MRVPHMAGNRKRERERKTAYCSGRRRESWPGAATDISVADTCRSTWPTYHVRIMCVREGEGGRGRDSQSDRQSGREGGREGEREGERKYLMLRRADTHREKKKKEKKKRKREKKYLLLRRADTQQSQPVAEKTNAQE